MINKILESRKGEFSLYFKNLLEQAWEELILELHETINEMLSQRYKNQEERDIYISQLLDNHAGKLASARRVFFKKFHDEYDKLIKSGLEDAALLSYQQLRLLLSILVNKSKESL